MENVSKYKNYSVEKFVKDADFRKWINSPNEILTTFWTGFQEQYPEKSNSIELARQIVENISFEEREIKPDEYNHSLEILKGYLSSKSVSQKRIKNLTNWMVKIAAILLLPVILFSVYQYRSNNSGIQEQMVHFIVPNGQKSNLILADGTNVWLNSGSELSYSANSNPKERKVYLKGEAFFSVTKDKQKPFLVETKEYTVKVYGTEFNVRTYENTNESETILKEGSVSILTNNEEIKMKPNQRFYLNGERKFTLTNVNPDIFLSWKDNILKINNEKLEDLIIRMERWYGVNIKVDKFDRVKDLRYTLTIKTESIREMLELMNFVTPFDYVIDGENVSLKYN